MRPAQRLLGVLRPYRGLSVGALVVLAAVVVMDLAIPRLIQHLLDEGVTRRDAGVVARTSLVMLGISALSAVLAVANNGLSVRAGEGVARDLREAVFVAIQRFSYANLDRHKTGQLLVRLTSDVSAVKSLVQISLRIGTRAPLLMLGSLALMVRTSPRLALALSPVLVVTVALIALFVLRLEPLFRLVQQRLDALNTVLQENVAGARLVKAFVRADHEAERFAVTNADMTESSARVMRFMSVTTPALAMCINAGVVVVLWFGGMQAIRGELSVGQLVAFSNYLLTTMTPLVMMTMLSNTWAAGLASLRRIEEVLGEEPDVRDAEGAVALREDDPASVRMRDASFAYGGAASEAAVSEVTLDVEPGKTLAILGSTGAGKSTLVNLVPRFYDATRGAVLVGERDVRAVTQDSLVSHVAMVPQETVLFSGTIRDNIRYGRPQATHEEVERAARAAQAHAFIEKMPQGYDSRVEQRGANLSGGQKQRVAIARALLMKPRVLILDDSTSAVDVETETEIQRALGEESAGRVTFLVAQRISTVLDADVILVLDKGRVVARGTHAELMQSSPVYREIYESQLGAGPKDDAAATGEDRS